MTRPRVAQELSGFHIPRRWRPLALAGSLVRKPRNAAVTAGTFRTTSPLFGGLLIATAIVVTALTFIPADALGPLAEHLLMRSGHSF